MHFFVHGNVIKVDTSSFMFVGNKLELFGSTCYEFCCLVVEMPNTICLWWSRVHLLSLSGSSGDSNEYVAAGNKPQVHIAITTRLIWHFLQEPM